MPRGRPPKIRPPETGDTATRTLEVAEIDQLKTDLERDEAMLRATSEFGDSDYQPATPEGAPIDKNKLKDRIAQRKGVLERESPRKVTDQGRRAAVEARMKELEERFASHLETYRDIGCIRTDTPEYKEAVKKALERPKYEPLFREWKELAKSLEPDDPSFYSLDRLRKDK